MRVFFPCGCSWPRLDGVKTPYYVMDAKKETIPPFDFDIENIEPNCPHAWRIFANGNTKGVFQLETDGGMGWSKSLKPENFEHLSALMAILRPGCTKAMSGDPPKSMTKRYCDRKNDKEPTFPAYEALSEILKSTYDLLIYQEQAMAIAMEIAEFSEQEADILRKCVPGDTQFISKQRGWITINELLETGYGDDEFLTMDKKGRQSWSKIDSIWCTGHHDVQQVTTKLGYQIETTKYHQILTDMGWVARGSLDELQHSIICAKYMPYDGEDTLPMSTMLMIAGLITEGYFAEDTDSYFCNADPNMITCFVNQYENQFGSVPTVSQQKTATYVRIAREHKKYLASHMKFGVSHEKEIPVSMMRATKNSTAKFLAFMFDGEGHFSILNGNIEYSSASLKCLQQIRQLLFRFGITSYILDRYNKQHDKMYYRLYISGYENLVNFRKHIGPYLITQKKQTLHNITINQQANGYSSDSIPQHIVGQMINQYPRVTKGEGGSIYNQRITRARFSRLAKTTQDDAWVELSCGHQTYMPIKSIKKTRRQIKTYDFTMTNDKTPYIVANGIVIHNSIGKKKADVMKQLEQQFVDGCIHVGAVKEDDAREIFGWIKESQRYSFNKSHSYAYGVRSYKTAYLKAHFPLQFYKAWFDGAAWKQDPKQEVRELVRDCRLNEVLVTTPSIVESRSDTRILNGRVILGLNLVRSVGDSAMPHIEKIRKEHPLASYTWEQAVMAFRDLKKDAFYHLVQSGAFDKFGAPRKKILFIHQHVVGNFGGSKLVMPRLEKEIAEGMTFEQSLEGMAALKSKGGACATGKMVEKMKAVLKMLQHPPYVLEDGAGFLAISEQASLGACISAMSVDDTDEAFDGNCTCKEFMDGNRLSSYKIACVLEDSRTFKTKSGKNIGSKMANFKISDISGTVKCVMFPSEYAVFQDLAFDGNTVMVVGGRDASGDQLIVKEIEQI